MLEQKKLSDMLERWLEEILAFAFTISHIPGILNVLPDCMSRMYAVRQRDIAGVAASVRVLSRGSFSRLPAHSTGLPLEAWHEQWDGGVTVCMMPDWFHGVLPSLGGGWQCHP